MEWISVEDKLPNENGYYLVWVPEWDGDDNEACFDVAFWNDGEWEGLNAFSFIGDGYKPSHWAEVNPPQFHAMRPKFG